MEETKLETGRMRRRDREIREEGEIIKILKTQKICHLAMCEGGNPYVIPMIYAYDDGMLFFHCAEVGKKLDILRVNPNICFEIQSSAIDNLVENSDKPCDWGFAYESAIGFGKAEILDDRETKIKVYNMIVSKMHPSGYVHSEELYIEKKIKGTFVIRVKIDSMTGKKWDGIKPAATRQNI